MTAKNASESDLGSLLLKYDVVGKQKRNISYFACSTLKCQKFDRGADGMQTCRQHEGRGKYRRKQRARPSFLPIFAFPCLWITLYSGGWYVEQISWPLHKVISEGGRKKRRDWISNLSAAFHFSRRPAAVSADTDGFLGAVLGFAVTSHFTLKERHPFTLRSNLSPQSLRDHALAQKRTWKKTQLEKKLLPAPWENMFEHLCTIGPENRPISRNANLHAAPAIKWMAEESVRWPRG